MSIDLRCLPFEFKIAFVRVTLQFFITFKAAPFLDSKHVVFGEVIDGIPLLDAMEE